MGTDQTAIFRFLDFELDVGAHRLSRNGERVELPKLSFDLLHILLAHAPDSLSREQLLQALWPNQVVGDETLTERVKLLRQVIEHDASNPELILTERGWGYRFALVPATSQAGKKEPAKSASTGWQYLALLLLVVIAVSGLLYLTTRQAAVHTLAILPFQDLTAAGDSTHIAAGVAEELNTQLARLDPQRLSVLGNTTAARLMQTPGIARQLDVDYFLEGSIRDRNRSKVVSVRLSQADDARQIWSSDFTLLNRDSMRWQRDLINEVAIALTLDALPDESQAQLAISPEARDAYLRGRYAWRHWTRRGLQQAASHFERALELEPEYAAAHAGLADVLVTSAYSGLAAAADTVERGRWHAQRALEIEPNSVRAMLSMAMITLFIDHRPNQAATALEQLRLHEPNNPDLLLALANVRWVQNCDAAAIALMQQALRIDPHSPIMGSALSLSYYFAGDYGLASEHAQGVLDMEPSYAHARFLAAMAATQSGNYDFAIDTLENTTDDDLISARGYALAASGRQDEAENLLSHPWASRAFLARARLAAAVGEADMAREALQQAYDAQLPALMLVHRYPDLRSIPRPPSLEALLSPFEESCRLAQ